jgi:hypothetical protein
MADFDKVVDKLTETNKRLATLETQGIADGGIKSIIAQSLPEVVNERNLAKNREKFDKKQEITEVDERVGTNTDAIKLLTNEQSETNVILKKGQKSDDRKEDEASVKPDSTDSALQELKPLREKLSEMAEAIEAGLGVARENKEYNKLDLTIKNKEFDLRKKTADRPGAKEEIEKERRAVIQEQGTTLQKISAGIMGINFNLKDRAKAVAGAAGKGLMAIISGTLFAGFMLLLAKFFESPKFLELTEKLRTFLKEGLPNIVTTVKGFAERFGGIGKAILGIGGLLVASVILAPIKMALLGLKLAFKVLGAGLGLAVKAVKGITNLLPSSIKNTGVTATNKAGKEVRADDKRKKVKTGKLASLGRTGLRGARFIPGIGLLATGASSLFSGGSAAIKEFNKEGSDGLDVAREAGAGILSGLTFGLVDQKTISSGMTSFGKFATTPSVNATRTGAMMKGNPTAGTTPINIVNTPIANSSVTNTSNNSSTVSYIGNPDPIFQRASAYAI